MQSFSPEQARRDHHTNSYTYLSAVYVRCSHPRSIVFLFTPEPRPVSACSGRQYAAIEQRQLGSRSWSWRLDIKWSWWFNYTAKEVWVWRLHPKWLLPFWLFCCLMATNHSSEETKQTPSKVWLIICIYLINCLW